MKNLKDCKTLSDIARQEFGKANYRNREKCKKLLAREGIEWKEWLASKKIDVKKVKNDAKAKPNICANCGKEISKRGKFCDTVCQREYYHKQYIERWKNGEENGMSGKYGLSKHIRDYLLEKHNNKCEKCGWGEINKITENSPLQVHHIDGDYTNNKEENLQLLCPNCHSLTETYMSLNKNGRKDRRKYNK